MKIRHRLHELNSTACNCQKPCCACLADPSLAKYLTICVATDLHYQVPCLTLTVVSLLCRSSESCSHAALKCVTLEYACLAMFEQCVQVQAAQSESAESSQKVRDLEEHLAELQQKLSLSAQAEAAARLDNNKARPLPLSFMPLMPCTTAVFHWPALSPLAC